MGSLSKKLFSSSLRLNTTVVWEVVLLLTVSVGVIFYYSRQMLRQESMEDAEETLQGTVLQVENVMRSIEQSTGNIYWEVMRHLDQPERMLDYSRRLVECNPNVAGCAIAFKPNHYPGREQFMAYVHRKKYDSQELITSETFAGKPYVEQAWYQETVNTKKNGWMNPLKKGENDSISLITLCIPIMDRNQECVGVMGVDLSLELLTKIVLAAKPSPNSYCILMDSDGSFIIHPDRNKYLGKTVFSVTENGANPTIHKAAEAMQAGETGSMPFEMDGEDYLVFYKPFVRSDTGRRTQNNLKWSIGIVYPEEDIFGAYKHLLLRLLANAAGSLLLFFILYRLVIRIQLKPLRKLTKRAQEIADGNLEKKIPPTNRQDEIGMFQQHFKQMQERLATKISKQEQLTATLEERRETLRKTYEQTQEANRVKFSFLENMTNQMIAPTEAISKSVDTLCDNYQSISQQEADREVKTINRQSEAILELVDRMLNTPKPSGSANDRLPSEEPKKKEDSHE